MSREAKKTKDYLILGLTFLIGGWFLYASISKYTCLNNHPGVTVGKIIEITGREHNDLEYARFIYLIPGSQDTINYLGSSAITGQKKRGRKVMEGEKYVVLYCKNDPIMSRMHFGLRTEEELGQDLDGQYSNDTLKTRFLDL